MVPLPSYCNEGVCHGAAEVSRGNEVGTTNSEAKPEERGVIPKKKRHGKAT